MKCVIRSGMSQDRPTIADLGELLFDIDTQKLFIGLGDGAKPVEVANIVRGPDDGLYFQATGNRFIPLRIRSQIENI